MVVRLWTMAILGLAMAAGCVVPDLDLDGRPCPCLDGWTCDGTTNTCVRALPPADTGLDASRDASLPPPDGDAATGVDAGDAGDAVCDCWTRTFTGTDALKINGVGLDADGDVYFTGTGRGTIDVGEGGVPVAGTALFAASVASDGSARWAKVYGDEYADARELGVADDGRNVLIGAQSGRALYGAFDLDAGVRQSVVLVIHDADGDVLYATTFPGNTGNAQGKAMSLRNGRVVFSGQYAGDLTIGTALPAVTTGDEHGYAAMFDLTGTAPIWAVAYPVVATGAVFVDGSALNDVGASCFTGRFDAAADFGAGPVSPSGGRSDVMVTRHRPGGALQWASTIESAGDDVGTDTAMLPDGSCVTVGIAGGATSFGGGPAQPGIGARDAYLAVFDDTGATSFARVFGGVDQDAATTVATDAAGRIYVIGSFNGDADILGVPLTSAGAEDLFVLATDSTGDLQWVLPIGATGQDIPGGIDVSADGGTVVVSGCFDGVLELGGQTFSTPVGTAHCYLHTFHPPTDPRL